MELLCVNIALPLQLPQRKAVKLIVHYSNFLRSMVPIIRHPSTKSI